MFASLPGEIVQKMRYRNKMSRDNVVGIIMHNDDYAEISFHRLEKHTHTPRVETLKTILKAMSLDFDSHFLPFIENGASDLYESRDEIKQILDKGRTIEDFHHALSKILELESNSVFKSGRNLQLLLSLKAQVYLKLKKPTKEIMEIINSAISITYSNFDENDFDARFLYLEETDLLHCLALLHALNGNLEKAIKLAKEILYGLEHALIDTESKEKKQTPVQLTLVNVLIEAEKYEAAAQACVDGYHLSNRSDLGRYVPDFFYKYAFCLLKLNKKKNIRSLLQCAYYGYIMLHKKEEAMNVLNDTKNVYNLSFETYGTENLVIPPFELKPKSYVNPVPFESIGGYIGNLRNSLGINQTDICQGLCSAAAYSKIENNGINGNIFLLESIMQRLGKHINHYTTFFPSLDEFKMLEIRDKITTLLVLSKYDEAEELLNDYLSIASKKKDNARIKEQFELSVKASVSFGRGNRGDEYRDILLKALNATIPGFTEKKILSYRLTYREIILVNQLALHYAEHDDPKKNLHGINIWQNLIENIRDNMVDTDEKIRMYETVLYNCSKHLGLSNRFIEALDLVDEGETFARDFERTSSLPGFYINRACDMMEMGQKKESLPFFAVAFYGSCMFSEYGDIENALIKFNYIKEHFGIEMDYDMDYLRIGFPPSIFEQ